MNEDQNKIELLKVTPIPHGIAVETAKLVDMLKIGKVGDVMTDEVMTKEIGKSTKCDGSGYSHLMSAIGRVRRDSGIIWARVHGAYCIKCLNAGETADMVKKKVDEVRHKAKRGIDYAKTIKMDEIDEKDRSSVLANIAQLGSIHIFSKRDTTKQLVARNVTHSISTDKLLSVFEK